MTGLVPVWALLNRAVSNPSSRRNLLDFFASFVEEAKIQLTSLEDGILKARELTLREVEELQEAGMDVRMAETLL